MQVFLRVVETGSFSDTARVLRMTPSTVSKLVSRIEARLGVRLLERSTRRISLTAEGQIYYERSVAVIAELEDVERDLSSDAVSAGGTVRVNASVAFGILGLEPLLPAFWQAHPNIAVDLSLSDEIVDLYLDRTDVAFRVGSLQNSSMTARLIGTARRKIVAAPAYLKRHGRPESADDLAQHNCLGFNFRRSLPTWPIKENGRTVDRTVHGTLLANNADSLLRMTVAGLGIARLADFHTRDEIASGRLVEILKNAVEGDEEQIHAVYLGGPRLPRRVRVFLDFVAPRLQDFLERDR